MICFKISEFLHILESIKHSNEKSGNGIFFLLVYGLKVSESTGNENNGAFVKEIALTLFHLT